MAEDMKDAQSPHALQMYFLRTLPARQINKDYITLIRNYASMKNKYTNANIHFMRLLQFSLFYSHTSHIY